MSEFVAVWIVLPFALVAGTIVHEGGYWATAAALRCDPRVVWLGSGRQLWQAQALGVQLVGRLVPFGGHVMLVPMGRDRCNAYAAVTAAEPAANLLALGAVLLVWRLGAIPPAVVVLVAGGQAVALASALLPGIDHATGRPDHNDRRKLLLWATGRDEDILQRFHAPIVAHAAPDWRPAMTGDFAEALFHSVRSDRSEPWGRQQAMDGLRAVLARGRRNPYEHLAAQKRLQRDLEVELRALIDQADGNGDGAAEPDEPT